MEVISMLFDAEGAIAEALEKTKTLKWATAGLLAEINASDGAALGDIKIILDQFYRLEDLLTKMKEHHEKSRVNTPRN
jgi:hypothetical protein